jgi:hypothetical protein
MSRKGRRVAARGIDLNPRECYVTTPETGKKIEPGIML